MAMVESEWTRQDEDSSKQSSQEELLNRYVLICVHEIVLRRRAGNNKVLHGSSQDMACDQDELVDRLGALCFLPNYIIPVAGASTRIDATISIEGLRTITDMKYDQSNRNNCKDPSYSSVGRMWAVVGGEESMLSSLAQQMSEELIAQRSKVLRLRLPVSWVGMTLSTGFYLHGVLKMWGFLQGDMLSWFVGAQQRHIDETRIDIHSGLQSQQFWFWKVFAAAFTIESVHLYAQHEGYTDEMIKGGEAKYQALRLWFCSQIRLWNSVTGVSSWKDARRALKAIVWPVNFPEEGVACSLWEGALRCEDASAT